MAALWVSVAYESASFADDGEWKSSAIERSGVNIAQGTQLFYESYSTVHPLRPPIREDYAITIVEKWAYGVIFQYTINQSVLGKETGIQALSSLDACTSLDPWWEPTETDYDGRCELWVSPQHLIALLTEGKTYLAVDTLARKDSVVRWEYEGRSSYRLKIDGRPVSLDAIVATTSRGDRFVIYADVENPLILSAKSSYFSWNMTAIVHER